MKRLHGGGKIMKRYFVNFVSVLFCLAVPFELCSKPKNVKNGQVKAVGVKAQWQKVQDQAQYGIVQIMSYAADPHILRPYAREGNEGRGSGSFIEGGYILSCYHVIENAVSVGIQMPLYCGKRVLPVRVVGVCPEYDMALLELDQKVRTELEKTFGPLPTLKLGDSDKVERSEQLLGLGFPLGAESLKSVTGVVSGYEHVVSRSGIRFHQAYAIQVSTPFNPGSSGGPVLNKRGEVVGICMSGNPDAQNVGFIAPINHYKVIQDRLKEGGFVRKPYLGVLFCRAKDNELAQLLGNPVPAGCYLSYVSTVGLAGQAGIQEGDMLYSLNGFPIDPYGCIALKGRGDRLFVQDYLASLPLGSDLACVIYRNGVKHEFSIQWCLSKEPAIRWRYLPYDEVDYEIVGGLLVQELSLNMIALFDHTSAGNELPAVRARLARYKEDAMRQEPVVVVTHVFASSAAYAARSCGVGSLIAEVNGKPVKTLKDVRAALSEQGDKPFVVFKTDEQEPLALPVTTIVQQEAQLAQAFGYQTTPAMAQLIAERQK